MKQKPTPTTPSKKNNSSDINELIKEENMRAAMLEDDRYFLDARSQSGSSKCFPYT
ncbi:MAG: hypothetical protein K0Q74_717 [Gammaproteobacteria bacterium]|jgi:hypothetical protein|nr:hypothetical protein [Gammaproteobacteria bacterium]